MEANLKSKALYRVQLYLLKVSPMLIASLYLINTVLSYYGIEALILSNIGGMSLIPVLSMYISSYVFRFCECHRIFLHYVVVIDILNLYDWYYGIPLSCKLLLAIHLCIAGVAMFLTLYLHVKYHKKPITKNSR